MGEKPKRILNLLTDKNGDITVFSIGHEENGKYILKEARKYKNIYSFTQTRSDFSTNTEEVGPSNVYEDLKSLEMMKKAIEKYEMDSIFITKNKVFEPCDKTNLEERKKEALEIIQQNIERAKARFYKFVLEQQVDPEKTNHETGYLKPTLVYDINIKAEDDSKNLV